MTNLKDILDTTGMVAGTAVVLSLFYCSGKELVKQFINYAEKKKLYDEKVLRKNMDNEIKT